MRGGAGDRAPCRRSKAHPAWVGRLVHALADQPDLERAERVLAETNAMEAEPYWCLDSVRGDCATALDLAGPLAEAEATARARAVPASLRVQRVLDLSARALSSATDVPAPERT